MSLPTAISFAQDMHSHQTRKTGEAFIEHCLRVMNLSKNAGLEPALQMVAVLHDVLEMTTTTQQEITRLFGSRVSRLVCALSKAPRSKYSQSDDIPWSHQLISQHKRTKNYISRLQRAAFEEPDVLFIKMFDQIDNLQSLFHFPPTSYFRILYTISHYFLPMYQECFKMFEGKKRKLFENHYRILESEVVFLLEKEYSIDE